MDFDLGFVRSLGPGIGVKYFRLFLKKTVTRENLDKLST